MVYQKPTSIQAGDALLDSSAQARYDMNVICTAISEVLIIERKVFGDPRGFFVEIFKADRYAAHRIGGPFVQDNLSRSSCRVLRGLHLQNPKMQGKLVTVLRGSVLDVAVDVRVGRAARPLVGMSPSN